MSNPVVEAPSDEITISASALRTLGDQMQRFLLEYRFAMREVETKLAILQEEFVHMHEYNPIEHVSSRVKSVDSLVEKLERRGMVGQLEHDGLGTNFDVIRSQIHDVAGVRVTCAFIPDVYRLFDLLTKQDDLTVLVVKDYIKAPKENGYQSLHTIISVPVFLSTGRVNVPVEVQFRTIAMDFWATLEHKIYYKYDRQVPDSLIGELKNAADTAAELDTRMERLHAQLHGDSGLIPTNVESLPAAPYMQRIRSV